MTSDTSDGGPRTVDAAHTPTVVGDPIADIGLDSLVVLQRARAHLLGRQQDPVRIGRYAIQRKLGTGGMGVVYEAYDSDLDRAVALKVLRTELGRDPERRDWLMDEAKALAKLSHPNVVHVYEVGRHEAQVYLAMELVEGKTLRAWVDDERPGWREIVEKYLQAGQGLIAAHEAGFVHRDFKPDNALVGKDGRVRVLDFGLARPDLEMSGQIDTLEDAGVESGDDDPTMTATIVGTPAYMDPQRIAGRRADQSSDQFAFFVSLHEALHGRRPFEAASSAELLEQMKAGAIEPSRSKRSVPARLQKAILRGLAFAPANRHRDMRVAIAEVEKAARGGRTPWLLVAGLGAAVTAGTLMLRDPPAEARSSAEVPVSSQWQQAIETAELPTPLDTRLPDDPAGVTVHRLTNGLTVYLAHRADRPRLATRLVVRAGLARETDENRGIARLTSNAMVQGSQRLGTIDFTAEKPLVERQHELLRQAASATHAERDSLVREAHEAYRDSADWLAPRDADEIRRQLGIGTSLEKMGDGLVVQTEVPTTRFEAWARLMAEEVRAPVFRGFTQTAANRLERIGWFYEGAEASLAMDRLLAEVGAPAPDPDAEAAFVRSLPLDAVMEFHRTFYVPNNTAIVIVGDIRPEEALPALEAAFGDWKPGILPPSRADLDTPWPNERRFAKVDSPRGKSVVVGFPLPPASEPTRAAFEALEQVLGGQNGLLQTWARTQDVVAGVDSLLTTRGFVLFAGVAPHATHEQVEVALVGLVETIAQGRVENDAWAHAMAHRELRAAEWARSPDDLADRIAQFHIQRRDWVHHAKTLDPSHVAEADVIDAARQLLARGTAVLHVEPGEPWRHHEAPLDLPPVDAPVPVENEVSAFGRELGNLPVRELEPRFLIDGRHFERSPYGGAELIMTKSRGPLFYATWVFPVGVRHDAFVCDAARHRADRWTREKDALASAHLGIRCGTTTTTFELTGVVDRFEEIMGGITPMLSSSALDPARLPKQVERTLAMRRQLRDDPMARASAFHAFALLRAASIDRWMPADAELENAPLERFERALTTLTESDPYVLYAGPDTDRVAAMLPVPRGVASTLEQATLVPPERSSVYLLAEGRAGSVDARLAVVRAGISDPTGTLAEAFGSGPPPGVTVARRASVRIALPTLFHFVAVDRPAHVWVYGGATPAVLEVLGAAIEDLSHAVPTQPLAGLRSRLEDVYRLGRAPDGRIPDVVLGWGPGRKLDPHMEKWAAIGRLGDDDLSGYYAAISQQPVIVSVVMHPSEIDREALRALGTIEEPDPTAFLRDVNLTDTQVPGPR